MDNWTEISLGKLGYTFSGLSGKSKNDFGTGKPYIPYLNIFSNTKINPFQMDFVQVKPTENQNKVQFGDIFFTTSSETLEEVGTTSVLLTDLKETYLNSFCFGFRLYNFDLLLPEFAAYLFRSEDVRHQIVFNGQGSTRYNLSKTGLLKNVMLKIPTMDEQHLISNILSSIDESIENTLQLFSKYERLKTGLLQDLLTRGIDEDGNIRGEDTHEFKDSPLGRIPNAWVVKPIKDLISITTGSSDTQDKVEHGQYPFFVRSQTVERSNQYIFDGEGILTSGDGVGVGKIYHYINGKFDFHQRVYLMYNFVENQINGKYFYYYFKEHFNEEVAKYSAKTTVDSVRLHMIADMLMPVPKYEEQLKIVSLLDTIERLKKEELTTLHKYQSVKRALMQDLLTGKVRVDALMKQTAELV